MLLGSLLAQCGRCPHRSFLKSVLKVQDELDDDELRALTCKNQELKGIGAALSHRHLGSVHWNLEETINELNATRNELSAAEDNLKVTKEEMEKYRQVEDMQHQLSEAEFTFQGQIAVQERNAVANWMKARDWERRIVQQSRENAYLKHRLRMMNGERLSERSMRQEQIPGRPWLQKPLWQGRYRCESDSSLPRAPPYALPRGAEYTRLSSSSSPSTLGDLGASAPPRSSTPRASFPLRSLCSSTGQ
ncbi:melanoma inhibitory activity protein 2-like [Mustela erminea]|uniref:melanoma inhibitory activity protein 2-like n=1 Tax=Mustela erminea TaxID=36723 RepID=UPI001387061E|nr:melanoma inhibitory activity protein 2-like [Mustela erminea]